MLEELARRPYLAVWFESLMVDQKTAELDDDSGTFWHFSNLGNQFEIS